MKKIILVLCCILLTCACDNGKSKLKNKLTKQTLTFVNTVENVCDTELDVENIIVLSKEKDSEGKYTGTYELYDCGEGAIYMTIGRGTYSVDDYKISFIDQYNNTLTFNIKSKDTIAKLDDSNKEEKTFKVTQKTTKTE